MNWLITDIDTTLVYTKRSLPESYKGKSTVVFQRDEDINRQLILPNGYQALFNNIASETGKFIAITARNLVEFEKINLPFKWAYKVTNFGALIYDADNNLIKSFATDEVNEELYCFLRLIEQNINVINAEISPIIENKKMVQIHFKHQTKSEANVNYLALKKLIDELNIPLLINFNKTIVNIFHPACDKSHATRYLLDEIINVQDKNAFTIGAGDSNTDLDFMQLCDYCITPSNSQLLNNTNK